MVCHISDMYPPLKPKGRTSGSRSKFESTVLMVTGFASALAQQMQDSGSPDAAGIPSMETPATTVDVCKNSLRDKLLSYRVMSRFL
jgi:hypothetical protein